MLRYVYSVDIVNYLWMAPEWLCFQEAEPTFNNLAAHWLNSVGFALALFLEVLLILKNLLALFLTFAIARRLRSGQGQSCDFISYLSVTQLAAISLSQGYLPGSMLNSRYHKNPAL